MKSEEKSEGLSTKLTSYACIRCTLFRHWTNPDAFLFFLLLQTELGKYHCVDTHDGPAREGLGSGCCIRALRFVCRVDVVCFFPLPSLCSFILELVLTCHGGIYSPETVQVIVN